MHVHAFVLIVHFVLLKFQENKTANESHRSQAEISAVHAAAVNGDKSSLSKLLDCMYYFAYNSHSFDL